LESLEGTEWPIRRSVADDAPREHGADPWQRFDFTLRRDVQIDHRLRTSSRNCADRVGFASDHAERLAHPPFRRIRPATGIGCRARSRAAWGVASIDGSTARPRRAAGSHIGTARRIDGSYLSRERLAVGGIGRAGPSCRAHDPHARAEHDDSGEEQQRFALGACGHGAIMASSIAD
jgi:hypothetical protein